MSSATPAGRSFQRSLIPFIGRNDELNALRSALDRSLAGRGTIVLIAGEPGIGKTRTSEVFALDAEACGARVLWGRCYEWEGAPAYWPWIQVLRTYIDDLDDDLLQTELGSGAPFVAQVLPELRQRLADFPEPPPLEPAAARFRLFEALTRFMINAARRRPLVIILEDLHWADAASLLLLQFLTQVLRDQPMLLLGTFRDVEITSQHPFSGTLVELTRELHTERLTLGGLSQSDVGLFIERLSGRRVSDALVATLHAETDGNPFFLGEVVRLLSAEGKLTDRLRIPLRRVPDSVREVIRRRLNRLPSDCHDILSVAAVIGREFSAQLLAGVTHAPVTDVLDLLDTATDVRLIEVSGPIGQYHFSHALIQETLYAALNTSRRMRLHLEIGTALEQSRRGDLAPRFAELAYHFSQAAPLGEAAKAISYAIGAAERASDQVAWETAIVHYQLALRSLEFLDPPDEQRRCEVLLALGEAHNRAGTDAGQIIGAGISAEAVSTFMEAARVARAAGLAEHFAQAAFGIVGPSLSVAQGFNEASELMMEALATLPKSDSILRAHLLAGYAAHRSALMAIGKTPMDFVAYEDVKSMTDEAVAMTRRLGNPATLSYALHARCHVHLGPDDLSLVRADSEEAVEAAIVAGDARLHVLALFDVYQAALFRGDNTTARNVLDPLRRAAEPLKIRYFDYILGICGAGQAMRDGRLADAEKHIEFALSSWPRGGIATGELLALRREQDRVHEVADAMRWIIEQLPGALMWEALWILALLETGRCDEARSLFASIPDDKLLLVTSHWNVRLCALYAEFCDAFDDKRRAAIVYEHLLPYARHNIFASNSDHACGSASHYLGILATTLGHWDDAERHFEDALEANERWGYPLHAAYTRYAWADALGRRGCTADFPSISALLERAVTTAERIGSIRLARHVDQLSKQIGVTLPAMKSTARLTKTQLSLSRREREVLALIIGGSTDKEIAEALFISPRTVTTHVTHILNKLGVSSRFEAAELASSNGHLRE
jgi:DNA-binding CsgD family transcriptional regulator/tetratricopeptide (TPR) repeat protein